MRIVFAPEADLDLDAAVDYLPERNPVAAFQLFNDVRSLVQRLAEGHFEGPLRTLSNGAVVRSRPVPPFRIFYKRASDLLEVVRIYHQARQPITR